MPILFFISTLSTAESNLQIRYENVNCACCDDENNLGKRPREGWQNMYDWTPSKTLPAYLRK